MIEKDEETFEKMKVNVERALGADAVREAYVYEGPVPIPKDIVTNIFDAKTQVIVNPVNLVGVMGAGLAKEIKIRYPEVFQKYKNACDKGAFQEGQLQLCKQSDVWILNFPTKRHWRDASDLDLIEKGLQTFVKTYEQKGITSITFPKLGCGLGGLDWEKEVAPLMHKYLDDLPIQIEVCGEVFRERKAVSLDERIAGASGKVVTIKSKASLEVKKDGNELVH